MRLQPGQVIIDFIRPHDFVGAGGFERYINLQQPVVLGALVDILLRLQVRDLTGDLSMQSLLQILLNRKGFPHNVPIVGINEQTVVIPNLDADDIVAQ
jgi:hypothetical protein